MIDTLIDGFLAGWEAVPTWALAVTVLVLSAAEVWYFLKLDETSGDPIPMWPTLPPMIVSDEGED